MDIRTREECINRITERFDQLPKRLQQCASFVLEHQDELAVLTVADVAKGAGIAPSAVMRFCQVLGLSGYSALRQMFKAELINAEHSYADRVSQLVAQRRGQSAALLTEFCDAAHHSINRLRASLSLKELENTVEKLALARIIHIAGFRRSFSVASYLAYSLDRLGVPTMFHGGTGDITHINALAPDDVVLAISYSPYAPQTLGLAQEAFARSIPVIAITDHPRSALAQIAHRVLLVNEPDIGQFRTLTATTTLAMTLAVSVAAKRDAGETSES